MKFLKTLFSRFAIISLLIILQVVLFVAVGTLLTEQYIYVAIAMGILSIFALLSIVASDANPDFKIPWITVIVTLFPIGLIIYWLFGKGYVTRKHRKLYKKAYDRSIRFADENKEAEDELGKYSEKYTELNGKILFGKDCEEFIFKNANEVESVKCSDGEVFKADYFISSIDPYYTYENLLNKKYNDPIFYLRYENYDKYPVDSKLILVFKSNKDIKFESVVIKNDDLNIGINNPKYLKFHKAIRGRDYLYCTIEQGYKDYEYLQTLKKQEGNLKEYFNEIVSDVKKVFKENFSDYNIEIVDILSPLTLEEKYHSYKGAVTGFMNAKNQYDVISNGMIPEVRNVLLSSSWLNSTGGILNGMITGKFSVCRLEKVIKYEKK